jgi:hypothetical protein
MGDKPMSDISTTRNAATIWRQGHTPVLYRDTAGKRLLVKLPYAADNRSWLRADRLRHPEWDAQYTCWEIPRSWFESVIRQCLTRYAAVYVIQTYRPYEKCAPACWDAEGELCECSCLGERHGMNIDPSMRWHTVSDAFAISWGEKQLACRLLLSTAHGAGTKKYVVVEG